MLSRDHAPPHVTQGILELCIKSTNAPWVWRVVVVERRFIGDGGAGKAPNGHQEDKERRLEWGMGEIYVRR